MGTPTIQGSTFVEVSYYDLPYSQYQPSSTIYSPSFEKKILQALDRIKSTNQLLHSSMKSLAKLEIHVHQSVITISRKEERELPNQPKSNPKR